MSPAQLLPQAHFIGNGRRLCPPRARSTPSYCKHLKQSRGAGCRGHLTPHWLTPGGHLKSGERNPIVRHWENKLTWRHLPTRLAWVGAVETTSWSAVAFWRPSEWQQRLLSCVQRTYACPALLLSPVCMPGVVCLPALWPHRADRLLGSCSVTAVGFSNRCEMALCCQRVAHAGPQRAGIDVVCLVWWIGHTTCTSGGKKCLANGIKKGLPMLPSQA